MRRIDEEVRHPSGTRRVFRSPGDRNIRRRSLTGGEDARK
jgi:hypothetical protein